MSLISVDPPRLIEGYEELKSAYLRMGSKAERIRELAERLPAALGEETRRALMMSADKVDDERMELAELMRALEAASRCYQTCENSILDNCEGAEIRYKISRIGQIDLTGVRDVINSVISSD